MKKSFLKIVTAGLVMSFTFGISGCDLQNKNKTTEYSVENCESTYTVNDPFSISGAKLNIKDKKGSETEVEITDDMIKSMPDMSTSGTKNVIIVYNGKEYILTIKVVDSNVSDYQFSGYDSIYDINEDFDISKLKLSIDYEDGTTSEVSVTQSMIKSMPDMSTTGTKNVLVRYNGKSYNLSFDVKNTKDEMMQKIQEFMKTYNSENVKTTGIKLSVKGNAKYLKDSAEVDTNLCDFTIADTDELGGYKIYQKSKGTPYVFVKEFSSEEELDNDKSYIDIMADVDYIVCKKYPSGYKFERSADIKWMLRGNEVEVSLDDILINPMQIIETFEDGSEYRTIFDAKQSKMMYKALTNSVVKNTMDVQKGDILSSKNNLIAQLDIIKILQDFSEEVTSKGFYNYFVNDVFLASDDSVYVEEIRDRITQMFNITDSKTIKKLDNVLMDDIQLIRNNELQDLQTSYDMIVELNDIIQRSNGDSSLLSELDVIISGIDKQDEHMISKFVYNLKSFEKIWIITSGTYVNADSLVEKYYVALKSFVEKFEDIDTYRDDNGAFAVKTFVNDLIDDLKKMDNVVESFEEKDYVSTSGLIQRNIVSFVRIAVENYIEMYDAEKISDILGQLVEILPEGDDYTQLVNDLRDCSGILYTALTKDNNDFVEIIKELCDELNLDKDYYINQYNEGQLTLFVDVFDRYVSAPDAESDKNGKSLNVYNSLRECCEYLDETVFVSKSVNSENLLKKINNIAVALNEAYSSYSESDDEYVYEKVLTDILAQMTKDENYNVNIKSVIKEYKTEIRDYVTEYVLIALDIDINDGEAKNALAGIIEEYLNAYVEEDKFEFGALRNDLDTFVDTYCTEQMRTYAKTVVLFGASIIQGESDELATKYLLKVLDVDGENETAYNALLEIVKMHSTNYSDGEFEFDEFVDDMYEFIDTYCTENVKIYKESIVILGSLLEDLNVNKTNVFEKINQTAKKLYEAYSDDENKYKYEQMVLDILARMTNSNNFNENIQDIVANYKDDVKEYATKIMLKILNINNNDTELYSKAKESLDTIFEEHLTAYSKNELVIGDFVADMSTFVDTYCENDVKVYAKSIVILATLIVNEGQDIDYNELFGSVELPKEIKDIDFNKLIKETLKDKDTYDILDVQGVEIDYVTDEDGNITKEILTVSLNANYDILLSSMDAKATLTVVINF